MGQHHILVIDDSAVIVKKLGALLKKLGYKTTEYNNPIQALRWLRIPGNRPDLIVVDVDMPELSGYEVVQKVRQDPATAYIPIIMLTGHTDMAEKVAGYEAGADDYLPKTIEPKELELRIKALLARSQQLGHLQMQPQAKVVTVFSLRGGAGTTSVAVNLAVELARQRQQEIGLMDLALRNGHCSLLLNIKPKWTIADLQSRQASMLDTEVIDQILLHHSTGVRLMPAPLSAADSELITVAGIDQIWPYMYATFPFLIIDGGSQLVEPTLTVLERSHAILLLISPELASLKSAADTLRILEQLKIDLAQVYPIINWTFPNHGLAKKDIENVLGHQIKAIIPYDSTTVIQAINTGKPAVTADPKSEFSQAINHLADSMNALYNKPVLSLVPKPKSKRSKGTGILRLAHPGS